MQFTTTAGRLAVAAQAADGIVKGGSVLGPLPAAQLLVDDDGARVVASDGSISLRMTLGGSGGRAGSAIVAPHPVAAFASSLAPTAEVVCRLVDRHLLVSSGALSYRFAVIDGTYSAIDDVPEDAQYSSTDGLAEMLGAVRHATDTRSLMVKLAARDGTLSMYATDSYRLSVASRPHGDDGWSVLLPVPWLQFALRYDPDVVRIDQRGRLATFLSADTTVTIRLGASAFPAVESALVDPPTRSTRLEARPLLAAANRLASVADGEPFRVSVDSTSLQISVSSGVGDGTEIVAATGDGSGRFGIAVRNLLDAVAACGEQVEVRFGDPKQPVWFCGTRGVMTVLCVVMPTFWQQD